MKISKKIIISIIIISVLLAGFLFGTYFEKYKTDNTRSMNDLGISIYETQLKAIDKGDIYAYSQLQTTFLDYKAEDFLPIALEMANKQNHPPAYYDVYCTLRDMAFLDEEDSFNPNWDKWNPRMERLGIEYLLIGAKLGDKQSTEMIRNYYLKNKRLFRILLRNKDLVVQYSETIKSIEKSK